MKVLHLTLKKQWFDLIASGEKTEEYREIKPYWIKRILDKDLFRKDSTEEFLQWFDNKGDFVSLNHVSNGINVVIFKNGYSGGAPLMTFKVKEIIISYGFPDWGAEQGKKYFVIKLGERIN